MRRGRAPGAVAILLSIELLDELVFGAREAAWPLIRADLSLSYAEIGLLLALPNLVAVVVEPVVFLLGDVHRRPLVVGGGLAFAASLAGAAASRSLWPLLVAFAVLYPASGAFVSLSQATLMDADPDGRERNMTLWTIAGSVGGLLGPVVLGAAALAGGSWRSVFLACALLALGLALLAARRGFPRVDGEPEPARPSLRASLRALASGEVVRWLVLLQTSNLLLDVLLGFLALYLVDRAGASEGVGAAAVAVWTGAGLVGGVLVLRVLRNVTGVRYLRASAWLSAALFAAFLLVPGWPAKLALLALLGIVNTGWYPVLQARLYAELPGRSGTALALGSVADLPASFVPIALGLVAEQWGLEAALWLLLLAPVSLLALVPRAK